MTTPTPSQMQATAAFHRKMERAYRSSGQTANAEAAAKAAFDLEYELSRLVGDRRFGSECRHERTSNGVCLNCQRKVTA